MKKEKEVFKMYGDGFQVSNLGNSIRPNGKRSITSGGYLAYVENGFEKRKKLQLVVAELFVPNPENKKYIKFKDGDKTNFKASNLEWTDEYTRYERRKGKPEKGNFFTSEKYDYFGELRHRSITEKMNCEIFTKNRNVKSISIEQSLASIQKLTKKLTK